MSKNYKNDELGALHNYAGDLESSESLSASCKSDVCVGGYACVCVCVCVWTIRYI